MEYNREYFEKHRKEIKTQHRNLLMFIYDKVLNDEHIFNKMFRGKRYYLLNYSYLSHEMGTSYKNIQNHINRLCGDDVNPIPYISKHIVRINGRYNQSWIYVDMDIMRECTIHKEEQISKRLNGGRKMDTLFNVENAKLNYSPQATPIVDMVITRYNRYFPHKIPSPNEIPTKVYRDSLRKVTDIYNGLFVNNRRLYPFSSDFVNNKSFSISGWKDRLLEVKGDWNKTKKLVLEALSNFELMHEPSMMPYKKDYLKGNLSEWLYDGWNGEGQSQFIQCLKKPEKIREHLGELKADRIYDKLPKSVRKAGNELFDMNPNMNSARLWENVQSIYEWGKAMFKNERSATYWCANASELPMKYVAFLKENEVKVNLYTLDIQYGVNVDGPWSWFVQDAVRKHGLHKYLATCKDSEAIENLYNGNRKKVVDF